MGHIAGQVRAHDGHSDDADLGGLWRSVTHAFPPRCLVPIFPVFTLDAVEGGSGDVMRCRACANSDECNWQTHWSLTLSQRLLPIKLYED